MATFDCTMATSSRSLRMMQAYIAIVVCASVAIICAYVHTLASYVRIRIIYNLAS